jgi:ABC-type Fe3+-hydroxamate transport system substrate-binding protein
MRDDTGVGITLERAPGRVVSLVPSLTESVAVSQPELLVGATDWCTHPADLDVVRVRGTKNPDLEGILRLSPDVVIANAEENREVDIAQLRSHGIAVWVTAPTTVPAALTSLSRLFAVLGVARPHWWDRAASDWSGEIPAPSRTAVIPIWRRPWMALGRDTFAGDVLARLGVANALSTSQERYPRIALDDLPQHDLVVLPDEPYAFSRDDGPEAFPGMPAACVSGRHLTWYGPSLVEARHILSRQLAAVR